MRWLIGFAAALGLLTLAGAEARAQSCANPGAYNSANGTIYEYDSAQNTYDLCLGLLATATPTSTPTATPTSTNTPVPTSTPTPDPSVVALATQTGCSMVSTDVQRSCQLQDLTARTDAHIAWWQPIIFITLLLGFTLAIRRQSDRA